MRLLIFLIVLASSGKVFSNVIQRNTAVDAEVGEDGIGEFLEERAKLGLKHRVVREEPEAQEEEHGEAAETPDAEAKSSEKEEKDEGKKEQKEGGKKGEEKGEKKGTKKGPNKNPMKKMHHHFTKTAKKGANTFAEIRKDPTKMMDFHEHAEKGMGFFG